MPFATHEKRSVQSGGMGGRDLVATRPITAVWCECEGVAMASEPEYRIPGDPITMAWLVNFWRAQQMPISPLLVDESRSEFRSDLSPEFVKSAAQARQLLEALE